MLLSPLKVKDTFNFILTTLPYSLRAIMPLGSSIYSPLASINDANEATTFNY